MYSSLDPLMAYYSFVGKPFSGFQDCAEVFVKNDVNVIEESIDKEIYAKGLGLVYKIYSDVRISSGKKNGQRIVTRLIK